MDTNLGTFNLTEKQFRQMKTLNSAVIKGFSYHKEDNNVVVVSSRDLTQQEKDELVAAINALPDQEPAEEVAEKQARKLRKKAILTKLGLSKQEGLALLEFIKDGNDD